MTPVHTHPEDSVDSVSHSTAASTAAEHYRLGFQECLNETMHFLEEVEGFFGRDTLCVQLYNHLQQHCDKILASTYLFLYSIFERYLCLRLFSLKSAYFNLFSSVVT